MPEFFLEIGAEEIPAGYIEPALNFLNEQLTAFFSKNRIQQKEARVLGTPRRLVVVFSGVDARQEDVVETHLGPNVKAAYDAEGQPTKAALGFARGKGIDVAQLTREKTPKGEVICARVEKKGQATETILNAALPGFIERIPFPKKMRWSDKSLPFARPIHWIVALFDGKVLNFEFDGLACGNRSRGHRFLKPDAFEVSSFDSYLKASEAHCLQVDPNERKKRIRDQVHALAQEVGGAVEEDAALLDVVTQLVEYPVALRGNFDRKYLELPKELLEVTMKHHQKYFPLVDADGKLMPHFITISNMKADNPEAIQRGNERVLRARLEDARFFFEEDRKRKLDEFVDELKGVVFQKALGTSFEKVTRFTELSKKLAQTVCPAREAQAARCALLCKADLVSQMVYEFPELQGIMGGYYAELSGEDAEVAAGIKEHYRPAFAGDRLPETDAGALVAVADKLDTILGCIGVGLLPSGSEDPYGLRRHSLGIIQIVLDKGWQFSLNELIDAGIEVLKEKIKLKPDAIRAHTLDLFSLRYKTLLNDEGYPYDAIDAVLSTGIDSLLDVRQKVAAFSDLKKQPYFEPLAIAFRRVVSILNEEAPGEVDTQLLKESAEKELYDQYLKIKDPVRDHIRNREFAQALARIVEIKGAVDGFFDDVMVMVKEDALRKNRLHLLFGISLLFSELADFSKIVLKKG